MARQPWAPWSQRRVAFDRYVDHLARTLHGRPATRRLVNAAVKATGVPPETVITKDHAVADWLGVRLFGVLLDHPQHMSR